MSETATQVQPSETFQSPTETSQGESDTENKENHSVDTSNETHDDNPQTEETPSEENQEESQEENQEDGEKASPEYTDEEKKQYSERVQKTINRLTGQLRESQEANAELAKRLEQLEGGTGQNAQSNNPQAPNIDDFDDVNEFVAAAVSHGINQFKNEFFNQGQQGQQPQNGQQYSEAQQAQLQEWDGKISEFEKNFPDYRERVTNFGQAFDVGAPHVSRALASYAVGSEVGCELLYNIATDPSLQLELINMSDVQAVVKASQIEAQILAKRQEADKPKVADNKPPKPLNNQSETKVKGDDDLSGAELLNKHSVTRY